MGTVHLIVVDVETKSIDFAPDYFADTFRRFTSLNVYTIKDKICSLDVLIHVIKASVGEAGFCLQMAVSGLELFVLQLKFSNFFSEGFDGGFDHGGDDCSCDWLGGRHDGRC